MAKRGVVKGRAIADVKALISERIGSGELRPFVTPPCPRCGTPLCDDKGEPRWELVGSGPSLRFVCLGGCPRQSVRRKAALS